MSLIKCPECGRENVSTTATSCPGCGFNIREYFENQQKDNDIVDTAKGVVEMEEISKKEDDDKKGNEKENRRDNERNKTKYMGSKSDIGTIFSIALGAIIVIVVLCSISISQQSERDNSSYTHSTTRTTSTYSSATSSSSTETAKSSSTSTKSSSTKSNISVGMRNALKSAKEYINIMPFSKTGLIKQLEYEGYSQDEAIYGAENCGADWKEQAAKSAKQYLDTMSFSKSELVNQLEYEGYTAEEAQYGVSVSYK